MLEAEFKYYIDHQDELVAKYNGKFIVIIGESVVGAFNTKPEAYIDSIKKYKLGTFLIQMCAPGPESYTINIYTRRAIFA